MRDLQVEILSCSECGAPVPIGDSDVATCVHCGSEVALPAEHAELRRLAEAGEADRRDAEALLGELDSPPWLATKVLAAVVDLSLFAFFVLYGIPVGLLAIGLALRLEGWIAVRFDYASADEVPFWITSTNMVALLTLMAFVPRAIGVYANRRATARQQLLASLCAQPPQIEGGPSGCRHCGAPLFVREGARVARCHYCRVESAVVIRWQHVSAVRAVGHRLERGVAEAVDLDAHERRETRRVLARELGRYLLVAGFFAACFGIWGVDEARSSASGGTPGWGIGAMFAAAFGLIALILVSLGRREEEARARAERRSGNDVPEWVGYVGPIAVLALAWLASRLAG